MKILHVAALVSRDGAYGGPLRVAMNHVDELAKRGHEVHLAAGWAHADEPPASVGDVPCRLFRARQVVPGAGFSGLFSDGLLRWLRANAAAYDVVHVHAGRDLMSLAAMTLLQRQGVPYVAQTHGMVGRDTRLRSRVWDAVAGRRALLAARRIFFLTGHEERDLRRVLGDAAKLEHLVNGVPVQRRHRERAAEEPNVLYCARLQERKRPLDFVEAAKRVHEQGYRATFSLVGPDEGQVAAVNKALEGCPAPISYEGSLDYSETAPRMLDASVYVLPSVNEPFPMSLLEALSLGIPSICTASCGLAPELERREAALVTDGTVEGLARAIEHLIRDQSAWQRIRDNGLRAVDEVYSMRAVGDQLERCYAGVVATR